MNNMKSIVPDGILLVDKPAGITSHDVVDRLRRKLKIRKIGHAGTLDPAATGLLIMLIGRATKASNVLMSQDKGYEGEVTLGIATETQDAEGEITAEKDVPTLDEAQIKAIMQEFLGDQQQIPPMFSAKKIDGVPLYKHARKGKSVEREPRVINISSFELKHLELPKIQFQLKCSKGTYVRTVAHDLAEKLDTVGHLSKLCRTSSGTFSLAEAKGLEEIEEMPFHELKQLILPVYKAVPRLVE